MDQSRYRARHASRMTRHGKHVHHQPIFLPAIDHRDYRACRRFDRFGMDDADLVDAEILDDLRHIGQRIFTSYRHDRPVHHIHHCAIRFIYRDDIRVQPHDRRQRSHDFGGIRHVARARGATGNHVGAVGNRAAFGFEHLDGAGNPIQIL